MNLSKKQTRFLIISNISCWALLLALLLTGFTGIKNTTFDVITAERINIVNEDGTTVMALANKQRIAAPRMNGKEYPVDMIEREHFAGMIFFNEEGDEIGGLIFNSAQLPDGRKFGAGHLSFDRYNDNQVINLEHKENIHGSIKSGITFYDRTGNGSFGKNLDLIEEYKYQNISESRKKEIIEEIRKMKKNRDLGVERVFLGSDNEIPQLTMKDVMGNERIKLFIDSTNVPRLHFYNEKGVLIGEIPKK
ncbi:hypothetical protein ATO12_15635 [Aquimarina atlantica]|uniref:Uncharacterized protein n=1 Tax=Aquimarina atlantica TaxID=1317122 RepID=A0A023BWA0_9FLAO|nr:hypothetical protein [Aquimarina atlantica]EZH74296.1 hypothetical protein ATO12_15635 [Aquimarina atlantica]